MGLPNPVSGLPNLGVLVKFKNSPRICNNPLAIAEDAGADAKAFQAGASPNSLLRSPAVQILDIVPEDNSP